MSNQERNDGNSHTFNQLMNDACVRVISTRFVPVTKETLEAMSPGDLDVIDWQVGRLLVQFLEMKQQIRTHIDLYGEAFVSITKSGMECISPENVAIKNS